jgi:hypothetical protein
VGFTPDYSYRLRSYRLEITIDLDEGDATAFLCVEDPYGQWRWVADCDLPKGTTAHYVGLWLAQKLALDKGFPTA